jgi:protein translocase SEC61 complex gamma subunit
MAQVQDSEELLSHKITNYWIGIRRIFRVAKKPTRKEFNTVLKICLVGMLIVGGLSYVVQLITAIVLPRG